LAARSGCGPAGIHAYEHASVRGNEREEKEMLKEFKEFALKGNVMDMAVGIIIGAAFGKIIASLVADVLMPVVGLFTGGVDFSQNYVVLGNGTYESLAAAETAGAAVLKYGAFIMTVFDFVIIAFVIFMMIKGMNSLRRKEEKAEVAAPPPPPKEQVLLEEIRDLLAKQ
jgi:large conductance mechanosensitive channel